MTAFYRWLYRSPLGQLFFDDMDAVVAELTATQHQLTTRTTEVALAAGLLEIRDAQYAELAARTRRAEQGCEFWEAFWQKSTPTLDAS